MKILLLGGAGQGKLDYAKETFALTDSDVVWGGDVSLEEAGEKQALYRLHLLVRALLDRGRDPEEIHRLLAEKESWIVLCDEVGCGVVPVDAQDRAWREAVGRLCCRLAEEADLVQRVCCGLPQTLKGEENLCKLF